LDDVPGVNGAEHSYQESALESDPGR